MAVPMLPRIAMPRAPPNSAPVSEIPEAAPARSGGALPTMTSVARVPTGATPSVRTTEAITRTESPTNPAYDHRGQQGSGYKSAGRGHGPQARHQRREPKHQLQVLGYKEEDPGDNKDAERERCQ